MPKLNASGFLGQKMLRRQSFWDGVTASMVATAAALVIALVASYVSVRWQRNNQRSEALLQEAYREADRTIALSYDALDITRNYIKKSREADRNTLNSFFNDEYMPRLQSIKSEMEKKYYPLRRLFGNDIAKYVIRLDEENTENPPNSIIGIIGQLSIVVTVNRELHDSDKIVKKCGDPCVGWMKDRLSLLPSSDKAVENLQSAFRADVITLMKAFDARLVSLGAPGG